MKNIKLSFVMLGIFLAMAGPVKAMEGTVNLESVVGDIGSCYAASVYYEGRYRVLMTCRGLRSALDPVRNKYVVWAKNGENLKRIGEVVNGKMRASIDQEFLEMVLTAERDGYVNKPEGNVLLSGGIMQIEFAGGEEKVKEVVPTIVEEVVDEIDDRGAVTPEVKGESSVGSAFKVLGKALLTGFVVLLGVVGVLSYLSRRKK